MSQGGEVKLSGMNNAILNRRNRKGKMVTQMEFNPDVEMAGESPQVNLTMEHTNPHVGEVGSLVCSPKAANPLEKEERIQDQIFSKKK